MQTNVQAVTCTVLCVVKRSGVSAMVAMTAAASFQTESRLTIAPRLSMPGNTSVTGRGIPSSARATKALVTLVERKSLYTVIQAVLHKTAGAVRNAVKQALTPHKDRVHTITYDNGREFTDHEGMAKDLETRIYFAHPYAPWGRGLNENTNGLIRQYFPKHRDLTTVTNTEIENAMNKLNHRPRKSLGLRTPYEVFFKTKTSLTVALQT